MSRRRTLSTKKKIALLVSAASVAGGGAFVMASTSNAAPPKTAAESSVCQGLATALGNNEKFIEGQKANPDAQSQARIANREAVIEQIKVQQEASGCVVGESAQGSQAAAPAAPPAEDQGQEQGQGQGQDQGQGQEQGQGQDQAAQPEAPAQPGSGEQVCNGSTVTLSGEGGAPAASSNVLPIGTKVKVTNLDNNKSTTVEVTSVSGSCTLLNNAAFEQVREPGKFLIRRAVIEKVG
ncbi:putative 23,9 kDa protein in glnII region [Streptomyces davaonensis JCM 4913]|uniref:Putative 23,9 kDa protein in glnII region n=1 Tax=Streptomyces davaonensis (strain DSM 101723 / JCM 4913 / KCC S-0913 / 768) TaxID=1214101 RepID=K4RAX1_STRDJ|nr:hypothetical protein [Streptomyces davaonensis]CCK30598.1 putative 23,9 kDa protein in glnII region [Streptomyces davaonensis JCM 4913]